MCSGELPHLAAGISLEGDGGLFEESEAFRAIIQDGMMAFVVLGAFKFAGGFGRDR